MRCAVRRLCRGTRSGETDRRSAAYSSNGSDGGSGGCDHDHSSAGGRGNREEVTYRGAIKPIWDADDPLEDDEWVAQARYAIYSTLLLDLSPIKCN